MNRDVLTGQLIEEERYELQTGARYRFTPSRREFVATTGLGLGAGLLIGIPATAAHAQQEGRRRGGRGQAGGTTVSQRLHIGADGLVTVLTGKVEVGQDAKTQVAQAAAEELKIDIDHIRVIMGDTEMCPNDGGTSGSRTTSSTIPEVRRACAAAREILLGMAAEKLKTKRDQLKIQADAKISAGSGMVVSFGDLASQADAEEKLNMPVESDVQVTRVNDWKVLGTSPAKVGGKEVVTGKRQYPSDLQFDRMLYGKVLRPPSLGAKLTSVDLSPAKAIDGVEVVRDGQFVGCAAPASYLAEKAVAEIAKTAQWDEVSHAANSENLYQHLKSTERAGGGGRRRRGGGSNSRGSVEQGMEQAAKKMSAAYEVAYIQHAPMEPRAAVAQWVDGKLTVWTGTQNPIRVRGELMQAFRLPEERVRVIVPDTGGGFGGKHTGECALEAARMARAFGRPVSLRWSRAEEFQWAYFRPAGLIEVDAGLDDDNRIISWDFKNYNSGGSAVGTEYNIPNVRCQAVQTDAPLPGGSYRALASTANNFARECFMDELAAEGDVDPLQFRLQHLPAGRLRDVLEKCAAQFGWKERRKLERTGNTGIGLACGTEKASYIAACVLVEVDCVKGRVIVKEVCQAFECGAVQNPRNLRAQIDGCMIMGLGGALTEEIKFADGKVTNGSFSNYLVPRLSNLPKLDTVLVNRPDLDSVGAGETPIIAIAPAISNAVFDAVGVRLRSMPLRQEKLKVEP
jgi:CO/xanthine dehydrogenase Mo-binding subunit